MSIMYCVTKYWHNLMNKFLKYWSELYKLNMYNKIISFEYDAINVNTLLDKFLLIGNRERNMLCSRFVRYKSRKAKVIHSLITSKKRQLRIKTQRLSYYVPISYTINITQQLFLIYYFQISYQGVWSKERKTNLHQRWKFHLWTGVWNGKTTNGQQ